MNQDVANAMSVPKLLETPNDVTFSALIMTKGICRSALTQMPLRFDPRT